MPVTAPRPYHAHEISPLLQPSPLLPPSRPRLLIVDDDRDQVTVLVHRLEKLGYGIVTERSGQGALERARSGQIDLILLDVGLPDISGYEVCQQLGDDPATWTIPIVMLSGTDDPEAVRRSRAAGSRFFLGKPYDPNVLLMVVQSALSVPSIES